MPWTPNDELGRFQVSAAGQASPEAQIKFLNQLLHIASDKIATLELNLQTARMEFALQKAQLEQEMQEIARVTRKLERLKPLAEPLKKKWQWPWKKRAP